MVVIEDLNRYYTQDRWAQRIGMQIETVESTQLTLHLPYKQSNMNLGGRMHGGIIASLLADSAKLLALRACLANPPLQARMIDFQISYLKAGAAEDLRAIATETRRTREFLFVATEVHGSQGCIAVANVLIRLLTPDQHPSPTHHHLPPSTEPLLVDPNVANAAPTKNMLDLFNNMMAKLYPGSIVHYMEQGTAQMIQEDFDQQYDYEGNISAGQLLLFADNVGGCAGGSLAEEMGMAVTLGIQATFCAPAKGERLIGHARTHYREAGLTHNQIFLYGERSRQIKFFGTMTHLARAFRPKP